MILARAWRHMERKGGRADHDLIASTISSAGAARIFNHRRDKAIFLLVRRLPGTLSCRQA